jgi:hypothetical protein
MEIERNAVERCRPPAKSRAVVLDILIAVDIEG